MNHKVEIKQLGQQYVHDYTCEPTAEEGLVQNEVGEFAFISVEGTGSDQYRMAWSCQRRSSIGWTKSSRGMSPTSAEAAEQRIDELEATIVDAGQQLTENAEELVRLRNIKEEMSKAAVDNKADQVRAKHLRTELDTASALIDDLRGELAVAVSGAPAQRPLTPADMTALSAAGFDNQVIRELFKEGVITGTGE